MLLAFSRALRRRATPAAIMLSLAAFCLSNAGMLLLHNRIRQLRPDVEGGLEAGLQLHPVLDYRSSGYTAQDVEFVLRSYGTEGRRLYALFELLDLSIFMWSYAALLSLLLSAASAVAPAEPLKLANLLPWFAALADAAENVLLLSAIWIPDAVPRVARLAPAASATKFALLFATASVVGGVGLYCVAAATLRSGRRGEAAVGGRGRRHQGQQQRQSAGARKRR